LQVYRDFVLTGATDWELLWDCWPAIVEALIILRLDLDSDGIPENSGAPDQTLTIGDYKVSVPTVAGCGLALEAAIAIGQT